MGKKHVPISLQLTPETVKIIDDLAKKAGLSRHKFMVIGIHHFINHYREDPGILFEGGSEPVPPAIKK